MGTGQSPVEGERLYESGMRPDERDVLEHFDAYVEMKGKLQHPLGTPAHKRKPDAAIDPWEDKKRKRRASPGSFGF